MSCTTSVFSTPVEVCWNPLSVTGVMNTFGGAPDPVADSVWVRPRAVPVTDWLMIWSTSQPGAPPAMGPQVVARLLTVYGIVTVTGPPGGSITMKMVFAPGATAAVIGIVTCNVPVDWPLDVPVEEPKAWHEPAYGLMAAPLVNCAS